MKTIFLSLLFLSAFQEINGQTVTSDSLPVHLKGLPFPDFKLELTDGSAFYTDQLPKNKDIVIILFSPECEHCQQLTKELTAHSNKFRRTHFVMSTTLPADKMRDFYNRYQLQTYRNITVGKDVLFFFSRYYQSHFLPFAAIYNRNRQLVKVYDGTITGEALLEQCH